MVDNTTLAAGVGGDTIATDDIGGVKFQRVKLIHGADGVNAGDVAAANPLPIYKPNRSATGSLTALNSAVSLVLDGDGDASIDVEVTALVGTIQFQQRLPAGTWRGTNATVSATSDPIPTYVNPASGIYRLTTGATGEVRVVVTAYTSGSAAVIISAGASSNGIYANQILPTKTLNNSLVSTANSTTANLAAAAVFTGTSEDVSEYSTIMVSIFSSHASATDGLSMQQSMDGTNWDLTDVYTIPAATGKTFNIAVSCKFYRLVYTNGATLTTSLRIQTIHSKAVKRSSSVRAQDGRSNENDFDEVAAMMVGYNGTSWDRLRSTIANGLAVDVTRLPALAIGTNVIGALTANQSVNNAQIGGIAPLMGNGVTGTGSQRVTIASDNAPFSIIATQTMANATTGDTGAKTATGNGATQTNAGNKGVQILFVLGAVSGTTPTFVGKVQGSVDGGTTFYDIPGATTASLTATGNFGIMVYPGAATTAGTTTSGTTATASMGLPRTWRVVWAIGGTTPSFTITAVQYNYLVN